MQLWIPPIDLPDGRRLVVRNAEAAIEPIRFLIPDPDRPGSAYTARYHVRGNRWELVDPSTVILPQPLPRPAE